MLIELLTIALTALLSSLLTLGLAQRLFERSYKKQLEERLTALVSELGSVIEERVRRGVLDAVAEIPSAEVLGKATRTAARAGTSLLEGGLSALLSGGRDPRGRQGS